MSIWGQLRCGRVGENEGAQSVVVRALVNKSLSVASERLGFMGVAAYQ